MPTNLDNPRSTVTNGNTLGVLWVVYGIIRLAAAVLMLIYMGTATFMFGALLSRVPNPFALMNAFHLFYAAAIIVTVFAGIFGVVAGLALLAGKASARLLALVASFLSLSDLPFGTTLGIYTLVISLR